MPFDFRGSLRFPAPAAPEAVQLNGERDDGETPPECQKIPCPFLLAEREFHISTCFLRGFCGLSSVTAYEDRLSTASFRLQQYQGTIEWGWTGPLKVI